MSTNFSTSANVASEAASPHSEPKEGDLRQLMHDVRELAHDHLEMVALETRLTVSVVLRMMVTGVLIALLLVSAWLALAGSAAAGMMAAGLSPVLAMLLVATINLILAFLGWLRIRHMSQWLGWPATQRAIKPEASHPEGSRP